MSGDPARLTATEALAAMRGGGLTSEALVRACLARIAAREPLVRAWAHLDPEHALAQARACDAAPREGRGPLHGLPIGVKDVIHTRDMPTRYNSPLYDDDPPPTPDAACVTLLRTAGAVILGKTATTEFAAIGRPPATRNPHDFAHTPGGSSGGSAAAVADFHVPLALGTQTGGSVIRPAAYCGVWAMKPSWGRISNEGCRRFAPSLDTLGWFARSAADLGLVYAALTGEAQALSDTPLVLAVCETPMWPFAEPATRKALARAVELFRASGVDVRPLDLDPVLTGLPQAHLAIMRAEGRVSFQPERPRLRGAMRDMAEGREVSSGLELCVAYDLAETARSRFKTLCTPFDAVIVPSAPGEAPIGLENTGDLIFNGIWTLLKCPCLAIPLKRSASTLPSGVTLIGLYGNDSAVLRAGSA